MAKAQKEVEKRNDTGKDNIRFCARSARTSRNFYESGGREFEFLWAHHQQNKGFGLLSIILNAPP